MRRDRPLRAPGDLLNGDGGPVGGADLEALRLLADLILAQETGIADGSLTAAGGYVWPNPQGGTVPSFGEILVGLR